MAQLRVADCVVSDAWFLLSIAKLLGRPTDTYPQRDARDHLRQLIAFNFKTLGSLAAIGRRTGVARILGVNFSGFIAWFLWREIYWSKLPRMQKKVRVAIDWALDVFFSKDFLQYLDQRTLATSQTEPARAPWNRDQLSDPTRGNNRIAA